MSGSKQHFYSVRMTWTGNLGSGTSSYEAYSRNHEITAAGKPVIHGSSDPIFRGDATHYNPEELLVAALSSCHMLAYLHLCAKAKITVTAYADEAHGAMVEAENGSGRFHEVILRPVVSVARGSDAELARNLHERAHELCFIAASVNFPVRCEPQIRIAD